MNKAVYLLSLCCLLSFGCGTDNYKPGDYNTEYKRLPPDAVVIHVYDDSWARWELNGECFLSYNLGTRYGVLTKVDCDK